MVDILTSKWFMSLLAIACLASFVTVVHILWRLSSPKPEERKINYISLLISTSVIVIAGAWEVLIYIPNAMGYQ